MHHIGMVVALQTPQGERREHRTMHTEICARIVRRSVDLEPSVARLLCLRPAMQKGFTLIELIVVLAIAAILVISLEGVVKQVTATQIAVQSKNELAREARFAMQRMTHAVLNSRRLLLPSGDDPGTDWPENIRVQTVPASPPEGSSTRATAVLAVTLPGYSDLDADGFPDADNDRDGQIDEDLSSDSTNDSASGIYAIDDGGDGVADESLSYDDDESSPDADEDTINGIDDDGDGNSDEDPSADMNGDGLPGIAGVDDDRDGQIDEGSNDDDDEDGRVDEDWYDPVVFYLNGTSLEERTPVPWDETGTDGITGRDFIVHDIADDVTLFRVERITLGGGGTMVDLTLELTNPENGTAVSLNTQVRVGGAL